MNPLLSWNVWMKLQAEGQHCKSFPEKHLDAEWRTAANSWFSLWQWCGLPWFFTKMSRSGLESINSTTKYPYTQVFIWFGSYYSSWSYLTDERAAWETVDRVCVRPPPLMREGFYAWNFSDASLDSFNHLLKRVNDRCQTSFLCSDLICPLLVWCSPVQQLERLMLTHLKGS